MVSREDRFVRWQSHAMAQMSVVLALFGTLSVGGLGLCFSLLQQASFKPIGGYAAIFLLALLALFIASLTSIVATVTRLLDFRLTAQKVRDEVQSVHPARFGADANGYGDATWRLFWCTAASLFVAVIFLSIVITRVYLSDMLIAIGI